MALEHYSEPLEALLQRSSKEVNSLTLGLASEEASK